MLIDLLFVISNIDQLTIKIRWVNTQQDDDNKIIYIF